MLSPPLPPAIQRSELRSVRRAIGRGTVPQTLIGDIYEHRLASFHDQLKSSARNDSDLANPSDCAMAVRGVSFCKSNYRAPFYTAAVAQVPMRCACPRPLLERSIEVVRCHVPHVRRESRSARISHRWESIYSKDAVEVLQEPTPLAAVGS